LQQVSEFNKESKVRVGWECIATTGKDIGKISHHSCAIISAKEVVFYGGLKGDFSS
jgi:hypothetical protein